MVTSLNGGDHFEMYRNTESLCCVSGTNKHSVEGQSYFKNKQTHRKRDRICGYQSLGVGRGGTGQRQSKGTNFQL